MVVLEDKRQEITNFIADSIKDFRNQKGKFNSVGIYCCPWSGWLSLSFNIDKSIADTFYSCPDFEIAEFNLLELNTWEIEYENEHPTYVFEGETIHFNYDLGDEVLNELFFKFLSNIAIDIKNDLKEEFLLQMLDSKFNKVF